MPKTILAWPARDWIFPFAILTYGLIATRDWRVPDSNGFPLVPLWGVMIIAGVAVWLRIHGRLTAAAASAIVTIPALILNDVTTLVSQVLRDLHLYLKAGTHFLEGAPVYLQHVLTERPDDLSNYPFLYPPLTLPGFAALSLIPSPLIDVLWVAASIGLAILALRTFGLGWPWVAALLVWPPFVQGLWVGNVAVPLLSLFAIAPRIGEGLVISPVFKLYSGITTLWLVRERRWRPLVLGLVLVAGTALVTLPIVGVGRWLEWVDGLRLYQQSQPLLPQFLYGQSLLRYVPWLLTVALAVAAILVAIRSRGIVSLERLGLATIVASPSLYAHGLLVGIPAILRLRSGWMWLVLALTGIAPAAPSWIGIGLAALAWFVVGMQRPATDSSVRRASDLWGLGIEPLDPIEPQPHLAIEHATPAKEVHAANAAVPVSPRHRP
jgi:hypothetical protein